MKRKTFFNGLFRAKRKGKDPSQRGTAEPCREVAVYQMANVQGAMAVQVVFHGYDHTYLQRSIAAHPTALRGGLVVDPLVAPERAAAQVAELYEDGFTSVRLKANLWPGPDGRAQGQTPPGCVPYYVSTIIATQLSCWCCWCCCCCCTYW